ncbi:bifunctional pyr operon transcriptional regulator/uracil phosphoribosyltransferase PyrR [Parafrankia sp. EUN1f]|uniref:bifunctional pyr operon transcriptional regulator/uracil phosphoribosyltransferase PyrR n=1 Tax=Parafrankia sp. EUN1f TaxID=102897 RepID=UPI0001C43A3F|nr:bifunctional pyr operon transcriptional regulator/uracil phosphoribosyltransferase PyrR [Parafrankia sp. EUN1f]EFC84611.1 Uracil phosphoribosyltransferase [Parafrankia sp. EUN1f]
MAAAAQGDPARNTPGNMPGATSRPHAEDPDGPVDVVGRTSDDDSVAGPRGRADRPGLSRTVLSAADMNRVVSRMAHQVLEKTSGGDGVLLLGIPTRGVPLAQRLARRVAAVEGVNLPVGSLDPTMYRDDLRLRGVRPLEVTEIPECGVDGMVVILVDDVLYSGRTVRAALDALSAYGRPRAVQLAVLVDRGHRELPIRADYVGKNMPTSRRESVAVRLREVDGADAVLIVSADAL